MKPASIKPATLLVRKYGNRRLYDTCNSRYVNLEDIAAFIRRGNQVQVVDAKSGEDLTRVTLTQIITEEAKTRPTGLPLELLRQLILASDQVGREFIMWYLKSAFDAYHNVQSAILSPVEMMKGLLSGTPPPRRAEPELKALRRRLAELESRVARERHSAPQPRPPRSSQRSPGSRASGSSRSSSWAAPPETPRGAAP
ncbi:MAG TPA: polyhydroxyalkanoate synthesis regulator DNA-binding domain-containing protein [Terriglobales bacterium]|jgi:polyhydroxyalkanoate synthesis repressor PhaR|nr:polyhydroxyalkanoate synthesis regulator DNA-binding domain-containing protein [Terriglobales bacterium]